MLTERLKQAMEKAATALLPEEQDQLAERILALLDADDDAKWDATFAENPEKLDRLAEAALADYHTGHKLLP
jgi:hypothetical protein